MRLLAIAAAALLAPAATASAADIMAGYYGNTVTGAGGVYTVKMHYRADHTFDGAIGMLAASHPVKGTWALDGKGNLCRKFAARPNAPPACIPFAARKVGDHWQVPNGRTVLNMTLIAGIH